MARTMGFFIIVAGLLCAFMGVSAGEVYRVGEDAGWTILGSVNYTAWASSKKFKVGDEIVFVYNKKLHNVMQVSKADYHSCDAASPVETYASGNDTVLIKRRGHYYFICGVPGHCAAGQYVDIRIPKVVKASSPPKKSPPSTSPSESPVQTSARAPRPGGSSASAAAGQGLGLGIALVAAAALVQSFM